MLLQIALRSLKCFPPRLLQPSHKKCNKIFLNLTNLKISNCRSFADNVETNILDTIDVQKYVKYLLSQDTFKKLKPEASEQLDNLIKMKANLENEIKSLEKMSSENDKELEKLIESEMKEYLESMEEIKNQIIGYITPEEDDNDNRNVELKIVSGIGGDEAKVFASELFNMYLNYAEFKNWEWFEDHEEGYIEISGDDVFGHLKHEGGVHRVQRVPGNDPHKRVHTSTCSVVVFPQPRTHEIQIKEKDLIVEKIKSSGPGGQNVNKRETCVRVKHIPTGTVVVNQTSRHQFDNLKVAINKIRSILFNQEQEKLMSDKKASWKEQAGTNDYSDKIRTYNFPQNRVTDHRINQSIQNLKGFMSGGKELDNFISQVRKKNKKQEFMWKLKSTLESEEYKTFEKQLAEQVP